MADKNKRTFSQLDHANNEHLIYSLSLAETGLYARILLAFWFDILEDNSVDDKWVVGKIQTTKAEILRRCNLKKDSFYHGRWSKLLKSGLIREEEGYIILPRFKSKKSENGSNGSEKVEQDLSEKNGNGTEKAVLDPDRLDKIEQTLEQLTKVVSLMSEALVKKSPEALPETPPVEKTGPEMTPNGLARYFLELAGHPIDPRTVKNIEAQINELLASYDYKQIAFCIKYITTNAKEKPRYFKYIVNGIPGALAVYEKENARKKNEDEKYNQTHLEMKKYDEIAEMLDAYITGLEPDQYLEYAERAKQKLIELGTNEEFITDIAISMMVKSVIRSEIFGDDDKK